MLWGLLTKTCHCDESSTELFRCGMVENEVQGCLYGSIWRRCARSGLNRISVCELRHVFCQNYIQKEVLLCEFQYYFFSIGLIENPIEKNNKFQRLTPPGGVYYHPGVY